MTLLDSDKQRFHLREFKTLNTLGEGRYAKVMLAVTSVDHRLGVSMQDDGRYLYAIKVINTKFDKPALNFKNANSLAKIKNEVKIMSILSKTNHKNVLKLYSIVNNESTAEVDMSEEMSKKHHKIYLIMDYCALGELTLENFQQEKPSLSGCLQKMRDIVLGVEFLHRQGIVHRDVKPSNLLIDPNGVVKLSDFGISYKLTGDEKSDSFELGTPCGTPLFLPPELCGYGSHQHHNLGSVQYGTKIDVWAMGVTFFYLFWGSFPFFDDNKFKLFQDISKSPLEFPSIDNAYLYRNFITCGCSEKDLKSLFLQVKNLVDAMLAKDLSQRFSIQQVKKHKIFLGEISKTAYEKEFVQYNDTLLPEDALPETRKPGLKDTFTKLFVSRRASKHKPKVDVSSISNPVAGSFKHVTAKPSFASDLNTTTSTIPSSMSSFSPGDEDELVEAHEIGKFSSHSSLFLLQPFPRILPTENASSTSLPVAQRPSFSTEVPPRSSAAAPAVTTKRESVNTLPSQFSDITPNLSSVPGRFESPESIPSTNSSLRHGLVRSRPTRNLSDLALSSATDEGIPDHKKHNFISMGDYLDSLA